MTARLVLLVAALGLLTVAPPARAEASAAPAAEQIWIPMTEKNLPGRTRELKLEATLYRAPGSAASRVLVLNHGSTGNGRIPATRTLDYPEIARFFVEREFTVLIPMRRGRGASEGEYLERYECDMGSISVSLDRALEDLEAAMAFAAKQPWYDPERVLLGGVSRGGLASVVYASKRQPPVKGLLNFVGGWMAHPCDRKLRPNQQAFGEAGRSVKVPSLWLYAENDGNFGPDLVRGYYRAFNDAGGKADLRLLPPIGADGHTQLPRHPEVWGSAVDEFLTRIGLGGRS